MIDNRSAYYKRTINLLGLNHWLDAQNRLLEKIDWEGYALDAGCGLSPTFWQKFTGPSRKVVNLDLEFRKKPPLALCADLHKLPFKDAQFSFIFSRFVVEHLQRPQDTIEEFGRILRPGGHLLMLLPNFYSLVGLVTSITPHWFHNLWRQKLVGEEVENAPTYYEANTVGKQKALLAKDFEGVAIERCDGMLSYFKFNQAACLFGGVLERICGLPRVTKHSFWVWARKK